MKDTMTQNKTLPDGLIQPLTVSVAEAAQMLGVGRGSVYALIDAGHLPIVRISGSDRPRNKRISTQTLINFINSGGADNG